MTEREEVLKLRTALEVLTLEGNLDSDIQAAYFDLAQAPPSSMRLKASMAYAREVLARYDQAYRVSIPVSARVITKEEHDALLDGPGPKGVSREEYERMMREAQE